MHVLLQQARLTSKSHPMASCATRTATCARLRGRTNRPDHRPLGPSGPRAKSSRAITPPHLNLWRLLTPLSTRLQQYKKANDDTHTHVELRGTIVRDMRTLAGHVAACASTKTKFYLRIRVASIDTHTADVGDGRDNSRADSVLGRAGSGLFVRVLKSAISMLLAGFDVRGGDGGALHSLQVEVILEARPVGGCG